MFSQNINNADVEYHREQLRSDFSSSQRVISIKGLREIVGNTFIQLGSNIHGKAKNACREVEEQRESKRLLGGAGLQAR